VEPAALGRFLPAWQRVATVGDVPPLLRGTAALERLAEVVDQLSGVAIPASVLERDVLPARVPGYQTRLLDELGALGEVAWVGRGSLGRDDGRSLYRPAAPPSAHQAASASAARHEAIGLAAPAGRPSPRPARSRRGRGGPVSPRRPVDLVGPAGHQRLRLRALRWKRDAPDRGRPAHGSGRPRLPADGRWSRMRRWCQPDRAPPRERARASDWHGIPSRVVMAGAPRVLRRIHPVPRLEEPANRRWLAEGLGAA
jgi:hypothetical protein